jgi:SHS2 domain-containing protein
MNAASEFEFVEGATSDISFVARGDTREQALAAAAEALLAATVEAPEKVGSDEERQVVLEEEDPELLLLRFLNELVYLRDAEGVVLRARRVHWTQGPDGHRLEADLVGARWDRERHGSAAEVKAATAHGLALEEVDGRWEARATLDV